MWVEETSTGKYKFCERYKDKSGKWHKVCVTLPKNRRQDRAYASDALRARIRASMMPKPNVSTTTLESLLAAYMRYQSGVVKLQTAEGNKRKLKTVVGLLGGDTLLTDLSAPMVREKLSAPKASTYNERLKMYKAMMRWAYREEMISDISHLDRLPKRKDLPTRVKVQDKYLEKDELVKLLSGMKVEHWKLLTEFLALSGLRIGEAIALKKEDVGEYIHVTKTYSHVLQCITDTPKTDSSVRDVFVQDELKKCIERISEYCKEVPTPYFIGFDDDTFISYDAYAKYFRENTDAILGRSLSPHALRHTHVALLAEAGYPLESISRRLGHADSDITKQVYMHVTERLKEKENERIRDIKLLNLDTFVPYLPP